MQSIVLTGRESNTTHSAFNPQGSASQGFIQFPLMQASFEPHSLSVVHPISILMQDVPLDPLNPGGQVQSTSWFLTVHSAVFSQGFSKAQGS
jgi:hypothetical protein